MKQIVFESKRVVVLKETESKAPQAGQVRVKMCYTAISAGTERASLNGEPVGPRKAQESPLFPRYLGYSGSGIVESVGEGVTKFRPGDRVIARWCHHSEYCTLPEQNLVLIPSEDVKMEEAAFAFISVFPLAAVRKVKLELGESCMVVGLGLLGLFGIQYARLSGGFPVIATDFNPERRALALKLGADYALDPGAPDFVEQVKALTGGKGVSTVIEVTGSGAALNQALLCTARFGRVALLGCTRMPTEVDFYHDVHIPGIQLIGAHTATRPANESYPGYWTEADDMAVAIKYLAAGRLNVRDIIGEIRSPGEAVEVYDRLLSGNFPIGVVFDWSKI